MSLCENFHEHLRGNQQCSTFMTRGDSSPPRPVTGTVVDEVVDGLNSVTTTSDPSDDQDDFSEDQRDF